MAEFLARVGRETGRDDWVATGIQAGRFALREVRADGTLPYWSEAQSEGLQQDLYHSGFEIRMLDGLARITGGADLRAAADRYFRTWLERFFAADGTPTFLAGRPDVVEVHRLRRGAAVRRGARGPPGMPPRSLSTHLGRSLEAAVRHLLGADRAGRGVLRLDQPAAVRAEGDDGDSVDCWGQAWMFRAMAAASLALGEES